MGILHIILHHVTSAEHNSIDRLQVLVLRDNELENLSDLGKLESLTNLDATGNKLTNVGVVSH